VLCRVVTGRLSSNEFIHASRQFLPSLDKITARQTRPDLAVPGTQKCEPVACEPACEPRLVGF
jgi:hypothetical protein